MPTREICKDCQRESCLGFSVPDEMWLQVMGTSQSVLCLACWDTRATALCVSWDQAVELWPVDGMAVT